MIRLTLTCLLTLLFATAAPACNVVSGFGFANTTTFGFHTFAISPVIVATPIVQTAIVGQTAVATATPTCGAMQQNFAAAPAYGASQAIVGAGCGAGVGFVNTQAVFAAPIVSTVFATSVFTPFFGFGHRAFFGAGVGIGHHFGVGVGFHRGGSVIRQRTITRIR
jgi:hypothetical protein